MIQALSRFPLLSALAVAGWMMQAAPAPAASPDGFEDLAEALLG